MTTNLTYETIIIGGGPAGLTAGIYTTRAGIKTLLLEKLSLGGQALLTEKVENYPGFPESINTVELIKNMEKQAQKFGLEIVIEEVNNISWQKETMLINNKYATLSVIIATGVSPAKLNVKAEQELTGRGISYCAICDGPLFTNKEVIVIGGGDTAVKEAIFLTKFANKVKVVHRRDTLRATKILQDEAKTNRKIEFIWNSEIVNILGEEKVEGVVIKNNKTDKLTTLECSGIFIFIGNSPNTNFLKGIVELDKDGYIITDENMRTSKKGIFAAGDCRAKPLRQIITAASDGAIAAFTAQHYVEEIKGIA